MSDEIKEMEVGKTYVFKSEADKKLWLKAHCTNLDYLRSHYKDGFTLDSVKGGEGYHMGCISDTVVIAEGTELKYFKLKEDGTSNNYWDGESELEVGMIVLVGDDDTEVEVVGTGKGQVCIEDKDGLLVVNKDEVFPTSPKTDKEVFTESVVTHFSNTASHELVFEVAGYCFDELRGED